MNVIVSSLRESGRCRMGWASAIATVASPRPYRAVVGQDVNRNNPQEDDWISASRLARPPDAGCHWYRVVDVRLTKAIDLGRGVRLSVIAEGFNLLNAENYAGYSGVQRSATGALSPDFGTPSGVLGSGISNSAAGWISDRPGQAQAR